MSSIRYLITSVLCALWMSGCRPAPLSEESVLTPSIAEGEESELDHWIAQEITEPYQIEVVYRWDEKRRPGTFVYPAEEQNVRAVLETIKSLWLESFELPTVGGPGYLRGKLPIRIKMYGGPNVDPHGVELLYDPTSVPVEMSIYNVNAYDPSDPDRVYGLMRSVLHQFAKRMLELYPYDRDRFYQISGHRYITSTEAIAAPLSYLSGYREKLGLDFYANKRGCYTMLSFLSPEDDMAESISVTLLSTPQAIEGMLEEAAQPEDDPDPEVAKRYAAEAAEAYRELVAKQAFIREYITSRWGLDLTRTEVTILRRMSQYMKSKETEA